MGAGARRHFSRGCAVDAMGWPEVARRPRVVVLNSGVGQWCKCRASGECGVCESPESTHLACHGAVCVFARAR
eukprot:6021591-Prymnesium_polylepis.1